MVETMESHKNNGIQVISRAASILRVLGHETNGLSLGQIARQANLPRSTVQRIVSALMSEGLVSSDGGSGGIKLGPVIQRLAQASARDTKDRLRPLMQDIADKTGETVDLAHLEGSAMLFIDQIVGSQRLRTVSSIGERFPLTTTANGKAALACLDEASSARRVLTEIEQTKTENVDLPALLREIETIRSGALATDEDEHTEGISAMGFAIRDTRGEVFAISVPVPSTRFARLRPTLTEILLQVRSAAIAQIQA